MNSCSRDDENWGICRSKSLGVYDDRRVLDVRMVKMECEISGGECDRKDLVVRQVGKIGSVGGEENLGGQ
jgi:hypothetical protein